jgi:tetratricopeptide (TPR) repeat protein
MQYRKSKFYHHLLIVVLLLAQSNVMALADSENWSLGKSEYEQGDYQKALSHFDLALQEQPDDPTILYYRANTFINLGLNRKALADYQQAYKLSTSTIIRSYCLSAMSSLTRNTSLSSQSYEPTQNTNEAIKQSELDHSLGAIQLQSALDKVRIVDNGALHAQDATIKQQIQLAQMKQETEQYSQYMKNATSKDPTGASQPSYSDQQTQNYLNQRQQMEQILEKSIQTNTEKQTQFYNQQAELTAESAANLANQLKQGPSSDGVEISPIGTNLYVRNYDFAKEESSIKPETIPELPTGLQAKEKILKN